MAIVDDLPDFLHFSAPNPALHISRGGSEYHVEGRSESFDTLPAAYNFIRQELGQEAIFDVPEGTDMNAALGDEAAFYIDPDTQQLLMSYDPDHARKHALEAYEAFTAKRLTYLAAPVSFIAAYEFLASHPVFWHFVTSRQGEILWEYEGYISGKNPVDAYLDEGSVRVLIEPLVYEGQKRARENRVLDTNLVVIEDTFEAAIVAMAARIERYYDESGAARVGVENTPYTQHLIERIEAAHTGD